MKKTINFLLLLFLLIVIKQIDSNPIDKVYAAPPICTFCTDPWSCKNAKGCNQVCVDNDQCCQGCPIGSQCSSNEHCAASLCCNVLLAIGKNTCVSRTGICFPGCYYTPGASCNTGEVRTNTWNGCAGSCCCPSGTPQPCTLCTLHSECPPQGCTECGSDDCCTGCNSGKVCSKDEHCKSGLCCSVANKCIEACLLLWGNCIFQQKGTCPAGTIERPPVCLNSKDKSCCCPTSTPPPTTTPTPTPTGTPKLF